MKALIQRVKRASVSVNNKTTAAIEGGLLVFLCIVKGDSEKELNYIAGKTANLRIFEDSNKKMNLSIKDTKGSLLVISQFTLASNCRKGNRPSFDTAEEPERSKELYKRFVASIKEEGIQVSTGVFGAHMEVSLINDGPATFLIESL